MADGRTALLLACVLPLCPAAASAQKPQVTLTASHGALSATDWLVSPLPLIVAAGQPASSIITIDPRYRDASLIDRQYTGQLTLNVSCCFIQGNPGWVSPGIDVRVRNVPASTVALSGSAPAWLRERMGSGLTLSATQVAVQGQPVTVTLTAAPGPASSLVPGRFLVWVRAEDTVQGVAASIPLLVHVLAPWPADGSAPGCLPAGVETVAFSQINPLPYAWKAGNLGKTSYKLAFNNQTSQDGLELTFTEVSGLAPSTSIVTVVHGSRGWPIGVRGSDSGISCSAQSPVTVVPANSTTTLVINQATTTTLVFSRSICRAFFIFCWGQTGMDDVFALSEGAFWTLFGGRAVRIKTVGNWDRAVNPADGRAELTITTPSP